MAGKSCYMYIMAGFDKCVASCRCEVFLLHTYPIYTLRMQVFYSLSPQKRQCNCLALATSVSSLIQYKCMSDLQLSVTLIQMKLILVVICV